MDSVRDFDDRRDMDGGYPLDDGIIETSMEVDGDERRMHVRAYNHWVSLLRGRAYPSIEDLDPENLSDFGPHSVLLDFTAGIDDPHIQFLGRTLREECGVDQSITRIADVPSRSLLSRLTDHYLQIIANRAPIGFEAEFVGQRGYSTMYRGILMPFSSDDDTIDFIYGVINWKEVADAQTQENLRREVEDAVRTAPKPVKTALAWADGPSGAALEEPAPLLEDDNWMAGGLADRLVAARASAAAVDAADGRSRAALYRALGRAYAVACAAEDDSESYDELLQDSGLTRQERAPMTPIVKLVFGAGYDKTRVTEFAAALSHGRRKDVDAGGFADFLERTGGGLKALVKAERAFRAPAKPRKDPAVRALEKLRTRPVLASVEGVEAGDGEFVLLIARNAGEGMLDIVAAVPDDAGLLAKAIRGATRRR